MGYVKNSERYLYSHPAFIVLFNLDMRIGEMAALTWDDVKIVSQNLGHTSTSVTLDTYTHLTEDKKKEQEAIAQTIRIS